MVYAKQCSCCREGMDEGYVINGGEEYYCEEGCLEQKYPPEEIEELFRDVDENGDWVDNDNYWTEWDPEDEEE